MKRCTKCKVERPTEEFAKDRSRQDGLQRHCKPCQRAYRQANQERLREANKAWKAANPDKVRENRKRRRARPDVKVKRADYNREWKAANPDKVRTQTRRSYERHAEDRKAAARVAREVDPEAHQDRCRRWREENKEEIAEYRRNNRQQDRDYYARNADTIREKKEARRQWCVYRITFADGYFYIGSSSHHDLRFNAHKSLTRRNKNTAALNGRDFDNTTLDVLVVCKNEPEALEQEATIIEDAMSNQSNQCLNSTVPSKPSKFYWVYVIQSLKPRTDKRGRPRPGFFYVGMTTDPARRLREHNGLYANGKPGNPNGGRYTSKHRPWEARALYGPYISRSEALKAEYRLKRQKRGAGRLKWSTADHPLCRGEGPNHPWVQDPVGWKPPLPE